MVIAKQTEDFVEVLAYDTFDSANRVFLRAEFFATRDAIQRAGGLCAESTRRLVPKQDVDPAGLTAIKARRPLPNDSQVMRRGVRPGGTKV